MKPNEIREMSVEEVVRQLRDTEEELSNLRFQLSTKQLASPIRVRLVRREVARLKTILHEHELGIRKLASDPGLPLAEETT